MLVAFFFLMIRRPPRSTLLSLHDALPICPAPAPTGHRRRAGRRPDAAAGRRHDGRPPAHLVERSEEHTSELQSQSNLVCRLLLEKKKTRNRNLAASRPSTDYNHHRLRVWL